MSGHTPGPWTYQGSIPEEGFNCYWLRGKDQYGTNFEIGCINGPQRERNEADARLIASAPDLLEALNDLLEAADSMRGTYGCIQGRHPEEDDTHIHDKWAEEFLEDRAALARAAIAKATK